MINILQYVDILNKDIQEYSCHYCCKPLQWPVTNMSPFKCYGCQEKIIDVSKIIEHTAWRVAYHLEGSKEVLCGSSVPL